MTEPSLNELPLFSPWPARLLGIEECPQRYKTPAELTREYDTEKWGRLLHLANACSELSLDAVDEWELGDAPSALVSVDDEFVVMELLAAHRRYREIIADTLIRQLPATGILELGCGYGTLILALAKRPEFAQCELVAGDYANSGVELTRKLAAAEGVRIQVGRCDFVNDSLTDVSVPYGSLIFTSFAASCIPQLSRRFVSFLSAFRPKAVIHFEPCYEFYDSTLLGLMRSRYIEVNDYNRNLVSLLHEASAEGAIEIIEEQRNRFGANPLFPASVIVWKPLR